MGDKITYVKKLPKNTIIVCSLVEKFNPENNDVWKHEANKSYPREGVVCSTCKKPVVLSGNAFKMYEETKIKREIACNECIFKKLEKQKT